MNAAQTGDRGRPRIGREPRIGLLDPRPGSRVSLWRLREESLWGLLPAARAEAGERSVAGFSPVLAAHLRWALTSEPRWSWGALRPGGGGQCAGTVSCCPSVSLSPALIRNEKLEQMAAPKIPVERCR